MERLLPRHMQIIYLINWLHLEAQSKNAKGGAAHIAAVSLIDESHGRRVRMGPLAFHGSRRVNGVSALHSELLKSTVFKDLHEIEPEKIINKTNGITFRRWLHNANPELTALAVETIGAGVLDDPTELTKLVPYADDAEFRTRYAAMRKLRKKRLAQVIAERTGIAVDPTALFDVQIKRIHEYKRQLLNLVETVPSTKRSRRRRTRIGRLASRSSPARRRRAMSRPSSSSSSRATSPRSSTRIRMSAIG